MHNIKGHYEAESKWVDASNRNQVVNIIDDFMATLAEQKVEKFMWK